MATSGSSVSFENSPVGPGGIQTGFNFGSINYSISHNPALGKPTETPQVITLSIPSMISRVIDELKKRKEIHLLYFYVKATEKRLQKPRTILWTFRRQIIDRGDEAASTLWKLRDHHDEEQIETALFNHLQCKAKSVYIIVDAVDEYEPKYREWLIESLSKRCQSVSNGPLYKILISSRNTEDLQQIYSWGAIVHTIGIQPQDNVDDIRNFVQRQAEILLRKKNMQGMQGMKEIIFKKLTEESHGMFLWVALQMETLSGLKSISIPGYIEQLSLPKKMSEAYDDIMEKLSCTIGDEKSIARRVLVLLLYAGGPVAVDAVLEAISLKTSLKTDEIKIDKGLLGNYKENLNEVVSICKHLVAIDEDRHVFRFIHTSVYEYLLHPKWQSSLDLEEGGDKVLLAEICLSYLCRDNLGKPIEKLIWSNPAPLRELFREYPLIEFASIHWARHFRYGTGKVAALLLALCRKSENMLLAFQIFLFCVHVNLPMKVRPTHIVSYFHLFQFLDHLDCERLLEPDAQSSNGFTAMHWALQGKKESVLDTVKQLIEYKADVNAQDDRGHTALYHASERGEVGVVRELLKKKRMKVDLRKMPYGTPLIVASYNGHAEIVQALIEAGANVTATSELGTALHAAASQGSMECVTILLGSKKPRRLDKVDGPIGTPLHEAAFYGKHEIVRLLLKNQFRVNKMSKGYGSPLQAAAAGCCVGQDTTDHKEVFEALVSSNADVNAQGGCFTTALLAAVEYSHQDLAELLVRRGANLDVNGPNGTAYQVASQQGHAGIMNLLQRSGANTAPRVSNNTSSGPFIGGVQIGTQQSKKFVEVVFEHRLHLFLRALRNNNMKRMETLISAYLKGIEIGITQKQDDFVQILASIGARVFKHVVSAIVQGEHGVQESEDDMVTPSSFIRIPSRMAQLLRKYFNKPLEAQVSQSIIARRESRLSTISRSYIPPFDCNSPEFQILNRFTGIGVSTLAYAIEKNNWKAVKILAEAWTSALERVRVDAGHEMFHVLFEARDDELQSLLSENDHLHAGIMAQVSIQLVTISLNRQGYKDLARDISKECVSALKHVEQSKTKETLSMLLEALFTEFEVGIRTRDDTKLKDCSQAVFEFMSRMIAESYDSMLNITADKYAMVCREAINQGKGPLMDQIEKTAGARGHEKVILHIHRRLATNDTFSNT
ncbi:hypothetical protein ACHAQJ_006184 [Trichoderma viride]